MLVSFLRQLLSQKLINVFWHLPKAFIANLIYGFPSKKMKVIGITGTDGKTTTATLIYKILKDAEYKTALISTVSVKIGSEAIPTGLHVTSPDPMKLQKFLRKIVNKGYRYLVLEVTSHGLDQFRLFGVDFDIGVVTNVTHEHLDYHKNFQNYLSAKAKLFEKTKMNVLNKEDDSFVFFKNKSKGKIISYGLKQGTLNLNNFSFKTKLIGEYNLYNSLAAAATVKALGVKEERIKKSLSRFEGVVGRMDEIKEGQGFRVFVDFAHTPNALEKSLQALRQLKPARLIAVFGCAGLRDKEKRPMMGETACRLADKIFLTAEDPRTEDVNQIIAQIASGCQNKDKIFKENNRQKAIDKAVQTARKNDIIGVFGKGHEQSLCFGKEEKPWSDHDAVKKALKKRFENE